ncbi:transposase [Rhizobium leguminosarum]|uniref:transposase n=1 Tax=Rhizobium leguminosarum TaxID=384 RepID=UPI001C9107CF|nr:transposase [Rhizobium leguminosarum]MBY2973937.1 transposase [Rhizobium leguminosarum]MBY2981337.1 transposase [Rhizobium leguminosarum]MBY2989312.1 transposase [Rhizobium leguminosarum]MBY3009886.1 transposase [Rhizobium leguminosarum]
MKASNFSEPQITFVLRQTDDGTPIGEVCRKGGISDATFYNWHKKYASLMPSGDEATSPTRGRECQAESDRRQPVVGQGHA